MPWSYLVYMFFCRIPSHVKLRMISLKNRAELSLKFARPHEKDEELERNKYGCMTYVFGGCN